jgi:hypothetical protein
MLLTAAMARRAAAFEPTQQSVTSSGIASRTSTNRGLFEVGSLFHCSQGFCDGEIPLIKKQLK